MQGAHYRRLYKLLLLDLGLGLLRDLVSRAERGKGLEATIQILRFKHWVDRSPNWTHSRPCARSSCPDDKSCVHANAEQLLSQLISGLVAGLWQARHSSMLPTSCAETGSKTAGHRTKSLGLFDGLGSHAARTSFARCLHGAKNSRDGPMMAT